MDQKARTCRARTAPVLRTFWARSWSFLLAPQFHAQTFELPHARSTLWTILQRRHQTASFGGRCWVACFGSHTGRKWEAVSKDLLVEVQGVFWTLRMCTVRHGGSCRGLVQDVGLYCMVCACLENVRASRRRDCTSANSCPRPCLQLLLSCGHAVLLVEPQ